MYRSFYTYVYIIRVKNAIDGSKKQAQLALSILFPDASGWIDSLGGIKKRDRSSHNERQSCIIIVEH
jgi:hypothetical protein